MFPGTYWMSSADRVFMEKFFVMILNFCVKTIIYFLACTFLPNLY